MPPGMSGIGGPVGKSMPRTPDAGPGCAVQSKEQGDKG